MRNGSQTNPWYRLSTRGCRGVLFPLILAFALSPSRALGAPTLKLGDILVAEPATASIAVVDRTTGQKTVIAQGGLLAPANSAVGAALAVDGTIIVAHRLRGVIRVHPVTGAQTVLSQGGFFNGTRRADSASRPG